MTKIEKFAEAAAQLSEEQIDGLLDHMRRLATRPVYDSAPAEVRASIERGIAERDAGLGQPFEDVMSEIQAKIDSAHR